MKNTITSKTIIALAITFFSFNSFAQNFYAKLNGGYSWATATMSTSSLNEVGSISSLDKVNFNFGKGINLGGAVGYMFNKNIGAELGINYLLGGNTEFSLKSSFSNDAYTYSATLLSFIPSIVITPGFDKINPYAKFGLSIGSATFTVKDENIGTSGSITNTTNITNVYSGGVALGLVSSLGATYKVADKISVFAEMCILTMKYSPTKSELTESKINGVDNLSNLNTRSKVTEYSDSYSIDNSVPTDNNTPRKSIAPNFPFSSIGVNVGIIIGF
ncbi:MAG: outer membrane beta-barrel protein [Bacteroidetes bacterium]|nr:outer membrane beta-barrel protein [Bacteroidota bacterium]